MISDSTLITWHRGWILITEVCCDHAHIHLQNFHGSHDHYHCCLWIVSPFYRLSIGHCVTWCISDMRFWDIVWYRSWKISSSHWLNLLTIQLAILTELLPLVENKLSAWVNSETRCCSCVIINEKILQAALYKIGVKPVWVIQVMFSMVIRVRPALKIIRVWPRSDHVSREI